jgi:hypothetical protein
VAPLDRRRRAYSRKVQYDVIVSYFMICCNTMGIDDSCFSVVPMEYLSICCKNNNIKKTYPIKNMILGELGYDILDEIL